MPQAHGVVALRHQYRHGIGGNRVRSFPAVEIRQTDKGIGILQHLRREYRHMAVQVQRVDTGHGFPGESAPGDAHKGRIAVIIVPYEQETVITVVVFHHDVQIFLRRHSPHVLPVLITHVQHIVIAVPGPRFLFITQRVCVGRNTPV